MLRASTRARDLRRRPGCILTPAEIATNPSDRMQAGYIHSSDCATTLENLERLAERRITRRFLRCSVRTQAALMRPLTFPDLDNTLAADFNTR